MGAIKTPRDKDSIAQLLLGEMSESPKSILELLESASKKTPIKSLLQKMGLENQMSTSSSFSSDMYLWKQQLLSGGAKEHLSPGTYSLKNLSIPSN